MTKELFRKEAIRHRTRALYGDVVLATPRITWVLTGVLIALMAGIVGFVVLGSVEVDGTDMSIWQWAIGHMR